jgi:large subunit ribosomal protein L29e
MAKSKNHTNHNQGHKNHRNGIKKPRVHKHASMAGVRFLLFNPEFMLMCLC